MGKTTRFLYAVCLLSVVLCLAPARASSFTGQSYAIFSQYYKDDVRFINDNDNRHLLPLVLAKRESQLADGRIFYELIGDTLTAVISTDPTGEIIESCVITLTAPSGLEYGSALYNDFAISGYHSYALLMAMHADPDPARRYQLVTEVVSGMAAGNGSYTRQVGVYTLTCTRQESVAVLDFQNSRIETTPTPDPSLKPDGEGTGGIPLDTEADEQSGLL